MSTCKSGKLYTMRMLQALEKRKIGKGDRFFSVLVPMLLIVFVVVLDFAIKNNVASKMAGKDECDC